MRKSERKIHHTFSVLCVLDLPHSFHDPPVDSMRALQYKTRHNLILVPALAIFPRWFNRADPLPGRNARFAFV